MVTETDRTRRPSRLDGARRVAIRAVAEFQRDHCGPLAAAIAYHVLFSIFPLVIVLTAIFGLVLRTTGVQADMIDTLATSLPLSNDGTAQVRDLLRGATSDLSTLGLVGVIGLVWSASGMMAALRTGVNAAFDVQETRPFLKGKLIDLALVGVAGLAILASLSLTIAVRVLRPEAQASGQLTPGANWDTWLLGAAVPCATAGALGFAVLRYVPATAVDTRCAAIVAGALAVVFTLAENLFAVYVSNFAHYNAIYGSLGAIIAFMFFVYLSAMLLLLAAEVTHEWPRRTSDLPPQGDAQRAPLGAQVTRLVKGLWMRQPARH